MRRDGGYQQWSEEGGLTARVLQFSESALREKLLSLRHDDFKKVRSSETRLQQHKKIVFGRQNTSQW